MFLILLLPAWAETTSTDSVVHAAEVDPASVPAIRAELEAMLQTDQSQRRNLMKLQNEFGNDSPQVQEAWGKQSVIDAHNIERLDGIVAAHGWPGKSTFGDKASLAAFLILQHADLSYQQKHLPTVRTAVAQGELDPSSLALLEDRVRLRENRPQLYGSQVNRTDANEWEPLPIENETQVDARRAEVGLEPLANYLQRFANQSGGTVSPKWAKAADPVTSPTNP